MAIVFDHSLGQVWASAGGRCNGILEALRGATWMPPAHRLRAERLRQASMLLHKRDREYFIGETRSENEFAPIRDGGPPFFVPLNLLALVAQKMADLLFGEAPTVAADDELLQTVIDGVMRRSWILPMLQGAAVDCCAAGDTFLEVTRVDGRAMIGHVPASEVFPLGMPGPDHQHAAYARYSTELVGGEAGTAITWLLLRTTYKAGSIERECYELVTSKLGESLGHKVSIERWPARRDGAPLPELETTGLARPNLIYVPNGFGSVSDFDGLIELQDALHAAHTQIRRVLAMHADPKLAAPTDMADQNGNLPGGAAVYFFRSKDEIPQYITWNAELSAAMEDRKFALMAFCIAAEMPPSLLGLKDDAVAETAAKLRLNASTALAKAARKATYWSAALELAIGLAVEIETLGPPRVPIGVTLSDGLPTDMTELAEQIATLRAAGAMSIERALRLQLLSRGEQRDELEALKRESADRTPSVLLGEPPADVPRANDTDELAA